MPKRFCELLVGNPPRHGVTRCSMARKHSGICLQVHSMADGGTENSKYMVAWISVVSFNAKVICRTSAHSRVHRTSTSSVLYITSARRRVHRTSTGCILYCTRTHRQVRGARSGGVRGTCAHRRVHCAGASRAHTDLTSSGQEELGSRVGV